MWMWQCAGCVSGVSVNVCAHSMFQTGLRFGWQHCCNIHNNLGKCNELKCHNISNRSASLHFWQSDSAPQCCVCVFVCVHWLYLQGLFIFCVGGGQWPRNGSQGQEKPSKLPQCHQYLTASRYFCLATEVERRKLEIFRTVKWQNMQNRSKESSSSPFYFSSLVVFANTVILVTSESLHLLFSLSPSGDLLMASLSSFTLWLLPGWFPLSLQGLQVSL